MKLNGVSFETINNWFLVIERFRIEVIHLKLLQNMPHYEHLKRRYCMVAICDANLNSQITIVNFQGCSHKYQFWCSKFNIIPCLLNHILSLGRPSPMTNLMHDGSARWRQWTQVTEVCFIDRDFWIVVLQITSIVFGFQINLGRYAQTRTCLLMEE